MFRGALIRSPHQREQAILARRVGRIAGQLEERVLLSQLWTRFDQGEISALDEIEQICLTYANDEALSAFLTRLREAGPGGTYQMKGK